MSRHDGICEGPNCSKQGIRQSSGYLACEEHEIRTWSPLIPPQLMAQLVRMVEEFNKEEQR